MYTLLSKRTTCRPYCLEGRFEGVNVDIKRKNNGLQITWLKTRLSNTKLTKTTRRVTNACFTNGTPHITYLKKDEIVTTAKKPQPWSSVSPINISFMFMYFFTSLCHSIFWLSWTLSQTWIKIHTFFLKVEP